MDKLDSILKTYYYFICDGAMWIIGIKMLVDILKNVNSADYRASINVLINGSITFTSCYMVIEILQKIRDTFANK